MIDETDNLHPLYTFSYDKDNDKFIVKYEVNEVNSDYTRIILASVVWSWGDFDKGTMKISLKLSYREDDEIKNSESEYDIKYHKINLPRQFDVDSYEVTKSVGVQDDVVKFTFAATTLSLGVALEYADSKIKLMTDNNLTIR